jgi:alcohol dehydrogenase
MKTRAAVLRKMGEPLPYAQSQPLVIEDLELEAPQRGEVLVQIKAAGLCHSDLSTINGSRPRVMPMVLGHEAAGIVREIGPGVTNLKTGDHVVFSYVPSCGHCALCSGGRAALCEPGMKANVAGALLGGGSRFKGSKYPSIYHHLGVSAFSEYTVAAQESVVKIDNDLPSDKAALFGCAVMTGVGAILNTARLQPGEKVAIFGMGGVGLSAVMGAKLVGANPIIAVDVRADKLEAAKRAGATHTIDALGGNTVEQIRDLTHGGVDCAIECAGIGAVAQQAFDATARGGQTVFVGLPDPSQRISLAPVTMVAEERTVRGSYMGSAVPRRDVPKLIALHRAGSLPVDQLVSGTIKLEELNQAFDRLHEGATVRQVLTF